MQDLIFVKTFKGHSSAVMSVVFSPDGESLASGSQDKTVKIWHLVNGESDTLIGHGKTDWFGGVNAVAFSPNGQLLASGSNDKSIKIWRLANGEEILSLNGHLDAVLTVTFTPDNQAIVSGSGGNDKTVKLWYLANQKLLTLKGHSDWFAGINSVAVSLDGDIIASGSQDKTIKIWERKNGKEICTLQGHYDWVCSVAISPNGKILASGSKDKTVKLWDLKTGEILRSVNYQKAVYSVAFSPNGKYLASGGGDKNITILPVDF
ncbi:MAG: WD40 repeat domain-containing protein [Phormidium sp.]